MKTIRSIGLMMKLARQVRSEGKTIGLVPTMGAFHEGHVSLIKRARQENDYLVVSIFVNPLQFGPGEDFDRYPGDEAADSSIAAKEMVDLLFVPSAADMYLDNITTVVVKGMDKKLCGPFRPGHFEGVATVVFKLFNIICPTRSYFGEKDYQQYVMLKKMVIDMNLNVDVIGCSTIRAEDGLALSSRNRYLDAGERKRALSIPYGLLRAKKMVKEGKNSGRSIEDMITKKLTEQKIKIDYVSVCCSETLERVDRIAGPVRIFVACRIGSTRLIDNDILEAECEE